MPLWRSAARPGHEGSTTTNVLTEEQFNSLPEIVYKGAPAGSDYDPDEEGDPPTGAETSTNSDAELGSDVDENHVSADSSVHDVDVEAGAGAVSSAVAVGNNLESDANKEAALEEAEIFVPSDANNRESSENDIQVQKDDINITSGEAEVHMPTDAVAGESDESEIIVPSEPVSTTVSDGNIRHNTDQDDVNESKEGELLQRNTESHQSEEPVEDDIALPADQNTTSVEEKDRTGVVAQNEGLAPVNADAPSEEACERETISTSCAICIDEFVNGEKLTLLPKCKHAFHPECIKEWLMERQGCCPLCKVDVLEADPEESPGELDLEAPAEQRFMISSM
jgi:hypothetical protein